MRNETECVSKISITDGDATEKMETNECINDVEITRCCVTK